MEKKIQLLIVVVSFFSLSFEVFAQSDSLYLKNRNYHTQRALYDVYRTTNANVVMLGNSITFGVNWNELMGRVGIVNRGIGSDVTEGFLHRLEYIYKLRPKLCCVMGGINDIYNNIPLEKIFKNYTQIIDTLRAHNITPIIQSTLYVSTQWKRYTEKNPEVTKFNALLSDYAQKNNIDFIDLNKVMAEKELLREELTSDGVHLNAAGYVLWREELEKIFTKYGL